MTPCLAVQEYAIYRIPSLRADGEGVSRVYGVNSGVAVGYGVTDNGDMHALVRDGSALEDLDRIDGSASSANDINADGQIVGWEREPGGNTDHAFIYQN